LLPELQVSFIARFRRHEAAKGLHRCLDLVVIVFYVEVLKDLAKVGSLEEAERTTGTVTDDFYSKVEVTETKV
jgi:hypothetical protein